MKAQDAYRLRLRPLLCSTVVAFVVPLLPMAPASAQGCGGPQDCALYRDQLQYLSSFENLPNTAAGQALLTSNLSTIIDIYQNATYAQRNQSIVNATTGPSSQITTNIWSMISNLALTPFPGPVTPVGALAINASSFQNGSAGAAFVPLAAGVASTANIATAMATNSTISNAIAPLLTTALNAPQIGTLKDAFSAYNRFYNLATASPAATYPYPNTGGATPTFPATADLRPYQISTTIFNAPWTTLPPIQQLWPLAGALQWTTGGSAPNTEWGQNENVPAFPSGHSTMGNTAALLNAILVPQAYQSAMVSALEFGLSRNVLGVHYPLDIIGGRILAYYSLTQMLSGNPLYAGVGSTTFAASVSNA